VAGQPVAPATASARARTLDEVPGWFAPADRALFRELLSWQTRTQPPGDIVELGVYLGKSAILLGEQLAPGETLTLCDLFGAPPPGTSIAREKGRSFATLDRTEFERYYLSFHPRLPVVLAMPTSQILDHVAADSARFVHIDASHLYEHVAADAVSARKMLRDDGIVVFDDYRALHTPGVAAAVWEAMFREDLKPIAMTRKKWYGTWGDPAPARAVVADWARTNPRHRADSHYVAGHEVLRIARRQK
jgi:predicted O-methyltransferase YrrM